MANSFPSQRLLPSTVPEPARGMPPPPKFANVKFNTIGQPPQLLNRFTTPQLEYPHGTPSPSPLSEYKPLPPADESSLNKSHTRPTLLESLVSSEPVWSSVPIHVEGNFPPSVGSFSNPTHSDGTLASQNPTHQELITNSTTQMPGLPSSAPITASMSQSRVPAVPLSSTRTDPGYFGPSSDGIQPDSRLSALVLSKSVDPLSPSTLHQIRTRLRSSLTNLVSFASPTVASSATSPAPPSVSQALHHTHQIAQVTAYTANTSLYRAQAADRQAQESMHASQRSVTLAQQSLAAAQAAHQAAEQSSQEVQHALAEAKQTRENAEELMRTLGHMETAIRTREHDMEVREERVRKMVVDTRVVMESMDSWMARWAEKVEEEQRTKANSSKATPDADGVFHEAGKRPLLDAGTGTGPINQTSGGRARLRDEVAATVPVDKTPSLAGVPVLNQSSQRLPGTDCESEQTQRSQVANTLQPDHQLKHVQIDVQQGPQDLKAIEKDEKLRREAQEKKREEVKVQKLRAQAQAAAKIHAEKAAKLKQAGGTPATTSASTVARLAPIPGDSLANSGQVSAGVKSAIPSGDDVINVANQPPQNLSAVHSPAVILTSHRQELQKNTLDASVYNTGLISQKFVSATTDAGRKVDTTKPFSSITWPSEVREKPVNSRSGGVSHLTGTNGSVTWDLASAPLPSISKSSNSLSRNLRGDNVPLDATDASRSVAGPTQVVHPLVKNAVQHSRSPQNNIPMSNESHELIIKTPPPALSHAEQASNLRHLADESGFKVSREQAVKVKLEPSVPEVAPAWLSPRQRPTADIAPTTSDQVPVAPTDLPVASHPLIDSGKPEGLADPHDDPDDRGVSLGDDDQQTDLDHHQEQLGQVQYSRSSDDGQLIVHQTIPNNDLEDPDRRLSRPPHSRGDLQRPRRSQESLSPSPDSGDRRGRSRQRPSARRMPSTARNTSQSPRRRGWDHYSPSPHTRYFSSYGPSPPSPVMPGRKRAREDDLYALQSNPRIARKPRQDDSEGMRGITRLTPPPDLAARLQSSADSRPLRGDSYRPSYDRSRGPRPRDPDEYAEAWSPEHDENGYRRGHAYRSRSPSTEMTDPVEQQPGLLSRMSDQVPHVGPVRGMPHTRRTSVPGRGANKSRGGGVGRGNLASRLNMPLQERIGVTSSHMK